MVSESVPVVDVTVMVTDVEAVAPPPDWPTPIVMVCNPVGTERLTLYCGLVGDAVLNPNVAVWGVPSIFAVKFDAVRPVTEPVTCPETLIVAANTGVATSSVTTATNPANACFLIANPLLSPCVFSITF